MSNTVSVKLVRSAINRPERQKLTLEALGLRRLNQTVQHNLTPQIEGMIRKVSHLVVVEKTA
jgi:large subunit ribosomal protein L30